MVSHLANGFCVFNMPKTRAEYEKDFQRWCIEQEKVKTQDGKQLTFENQEFALYKPLTILTREFGSLDGEKPNNKVIAKPDLIFRICRTIYVAEIKYIPFETSNFWSALKCLAYSAYYTWQEGKPSKPAIFMPEEAIKLEHQIIASQLKIMLFGIKYKNKKWFIKKINEKHQTKQSRR
jgi:hypothetical protein